MADSDSERYPSRWWLWLDKLSVWLDRFREWLSEHPKTYALVVFCAFILLFCLLLYSLSQCQPYCYPGP